MTEKSGGPEMHGGAVAGSNAAHADMQPQAGAGSAGGAGGKADEELDEDEMPPAPTAADRLKSIRLVPSALSEKMLTRLRTEGVEVDAPRQPVLPASGTGEVGTSGESPAVTASVRAQCARLGLDGAPRARLPAPMPGPSRLPACTVGLAQHNSSLWEKFRQRCGTPVSAEAPPIPCQLRVSGGGGQVVAPLLISTGASVGA